MFNLRDGFFLKEQSIFNVSSSTQPIRLRLVSWLNYGLVRFMIGIAGYAPGKQSGQV